MESTPTPMPISTSVLRLGYQEQDTRLTLREGLAEYYEANPGLVDPSEASTEDLGVYFRSHDVSHVFFGTTTSLLDEALQDAWTFLAIDVTKREYVGDFVKTEEGKRIMTSIPIWRGWESYLDKPLGETRREFGLRVF